MQNWNKQIDFQSIIVRVRVPSALPDYNGRLAETD